MKLFYIDESGDTATFSQGGRKYLVLCGCIVDDGDYLEIERRLRDIKLKYWNNSDIEIKSIFCGMLIRTCQRFLLIGVIRKRRR
ncbi:DUF3800 domain-containing protein [bacterium]|nr:DUF3800 domain-containing protein [bacterium]